MKQTVVFDFDGVIHSYISGWKGIITIPDPPVPGIAEAIQNIRKHYVVAVVSTRCSTPEGIEAVNSWLDKYGIEVDAVLKEKPPAIVYIDDRAICFDGDPSRLLSRIQTFEAWNKKPIVSEQLRKLCEENEAYVDETGTQEWRNQLLEKFNRII